MRIFLAIFLLAKLCFAFSANELKILFDERNFKQICTKDVENFCAKTNDEALINLYATACLKIHKINSLFLPITKLRQSSKARENAAYFADILLKKKLLYHALIDKQDISYMRLAKSDYILSMIFERFVRGEFEHIDENYVFKEKNSDVFYELYATKDEPIQKIVLIICKNDKILEKIEYY